MVSIRSRWLMAACMLLVGHAGADSSPAGGEKDRIEALVEDLGSGEYWRRESAAAELRALGPSAIDSLLAAAERSDDLEIALAARWLVDGIPLVADSDPPEVAELVEEYVRSRSSDWLPAVQRLLRVDDDAGIEPLARIVRLDRSLAASAAAAALLAGPRLAGVKTVAYLPRTVRGHAVLVALACEEIVMAPLHLGRRRRQQPHDPERPATASGRRDRRRLQFLDLQHRLPTPEVGQVRFRAHCARLRRDRHAPRRRSRRGRGRPDRRPDGGCDGRGVARGSGCEEGPQLVAAGRDGETRGRRSAGDGEAVDGVHPTRAVEQREGAQRAHQRREVRGLGRSRPSSTSSTRSPLRRSPTASPSSCSRWRGRAPTARSRG